MKKILIATASLLLSSCNYLPNRNTSINITNEYFFSVNNNTTKVLNLSERGDFAKPKGVLGVKKADALPFRETTYTSLPRDDVLDSENTTYECGAASYDAKGRPDSWFFFKYTFFVKNSSASIAEYTLSINCDDFPRFVDGSGRRFDDTLRVMVYDTEINDSGEHTNKEVYAKESNFNHYDMDGNKTRREFISTHPYDDREDDEHRLANSFLPGQEMIRYRVSAFEPNAIKRYTIVLWLEGNDPDSNSEYVVTGLTGDFIFEVKLDGYIV